MLSAVFEIVFPLALWLLALGAIIYVGRKGCGGDLCQLPSGRRYGELVEELFEAEQARNRIVVGFASRQGTRIAWLEQLYASDKKVAEPKPELH